MDLIEIGNDLIVASIIPAIGGAVFSLHALCANEAVPIFRQSGVGASRPFEFASTVLAPFSNRISGGGFWFEGQFYDVPADQPGQGMAIHGDALSRVWTVELTKPTTLDLSLDHGGMGPFEYSARMTFDVKGNTFRQALTLTNTGRRLPFGGGFHPFFPRRPDTILRFQADGIWLAGENRIPTRHVPVDDAPHWDFRNGSALPDTLLDNAFTGWTGPAEIRQPSLGIQVAVSASSNLGTTVAFAPDPEKHFFCFEPVMHPVDAFNMDGLPGLQILDPGESLTFSMCISWLPLPGT